MGSFQRSKFFKRFLAAIAALFLLSVDLVFPTPALAISSLDGCLADPVCAVKLGFDAKPFVASPIVKSSVKTVAVDVLNSSGAVVGSTTAQISTVAGAATSPTSPINLGIAGLGAAAMAVGFPQVRSLQNTARTKYCSTHSSEPVCAPLPVSDQAIANILSASPGAVTGNYVNSDCSPNPAYVATLTFNGDTHYIGDVNFSPGGPGCTAFGLVPKENISSWDKWSQPQRDAATDLLTNSDYSSAAKKAPIVLVTPTTYPPGATKVNITNLDKIINDSAPTGGPTGSPTSPAPSPTVIFINGPSPDPAPAPAPSPSPSPTTDADDPNCKCCSSAPPDPVTGKLPSLDHECDVEFTDQNFLSYAIDKTSSKFPFDFLGSIASVNPPYPCPTFTFWGQTHEFCIINDTLKAFKWIVWIVFSIKSVVSL